MIETRGRAGTLVSASGDVTHQHAQTAAAAYAARVRELGVDADEALALVDGGAAPTPADCSRYSTGGVGQRFLRQLAHLAPRRLRRSGIIERISSSLPKQSSRSPASSIDVPARVRHDRWCRGAA